MSVFLMSALHQFVFNVTFWNIDFPSSDTTRPSNAVIAKILSSLLVSSGVYLIEKTLLHLFAIRFHRLSYDDRIREAKVFDTVFILPRFTSL